MCGWNDCSLIKMCHSAYVVLCMSNSRESFFFVYMHEKNKSIKNVSYLTICPFNLVLGIAFKLCESVSLCMTKYHTMTTGSISVTCRHSLRRGHWNSSSLRACMLQRVHLLKSHVCSGLGQRLPKLQCKVREKLVPERTGISAVEGYGSYYKSVVKVIFPFFFFFFKARPSTMLIIFWHLLPSPIIFQNGKTTVASLIVTFDVL